MLLLLTLLTAPATACLWDDDTLAVEQAGMPDITAVLAGRFDRHPARYYEVRLQLAQARIAQAPDDLAAYDNAAVALDRLGRPTEAIALMESGDDARGSLDGSMPITQQMRRALWGPWLGREHAFYREAAALVSGMSWSEVAHLGGGRLARKLEVVEDAIEDLDNRRLPPFVQKGRLSILDEDEEGAWVRSYRAYDAVYLTRGQLEVIRGLNTNALEDVAERLDELEGEAVMPAWLRELVEKGVLRATLPPFEPGDGP